METKDKEQAKVLPDVQKLPLESSESDWQKRLKEIWDRKYKPLRKAIIEAVDGR